MGQQITDWSVLTQDVIDICEQQAAKVARSFVGVTEYDDLRQEAFIWAATHPAEVKGYVLNEQFGFLAKRVWSRLMNIATPELNRRVVRHEDGSTTPRFVSMDALTDS